MKCIKIDYLFTITNFLHKKVKKIRQEVQILTEKIVETDDR